MADAHVGKDAVLEVGPAANNLSVLSGEGDGLDTHQLARQFTTRIIPGGGNSVRRQSLGMEDQTLTFSTDYNSVTEPLIFGKEGSILYWRWSPRGRGSGAPFRTGRGILGYELSGPFNDAMRFSCTVEGDGASTAGNH